MRPDKSVLDRRSLSKFPNLLMLSGITPDIYGSIPNMELLKADQSADG
jgi:hypothetical protein